MGREGRTIERAIPAVILPAETPTASASGIATRAGTLATESTVKAEVVPPNELRAALTTMTEVLRPH